MNIKSSEVLNEVESILKANPYIDQVVTLEQAVSLVKETNKTAVYINIANIVPKITRQVPDISGYDFHGFFSIVLNVNCKGDKTLIYDIMDSVYRSFLDDQMVWLKVVDRDILSTEFDNSEFFPMRSAIMILEITYRLVS